MLKRFLDPATLTLSRPQSAGELTVLPLLRPGTAEPGYLTLGEALVGAKQNRVLNLTVLAPAPPRWRR